MSEDRRYYVYMWYRLENDSIIPFYVGKGSGNRSTNKGSRSKYFKEYIVRYECESMIIAKHLTEIMAFCVEERVKEELVKRGYKLLDAESNKEERKRRQAEGIAAMKARGEWDNYGRPHKPTEDFEKLAQKQKSGELTVAQCCAQLNISRATWYNRIRSVGV